MTEPEQRFDVQPSVSNHFAWIRTQLGMQRTLMAAVRTSVSLIGFGFTVAQFFQRLRSGADDTPHIGPDMPRNLGLVLIAAGVISLVVFTWQYWSAEKYLREGPFASIAMDKQRPMHTSTYLIATVVILIGIAAFASVFARF